MSAPLIPSHRAEAIAEGLVRTGRGFDVRPVRTWLQLRAKGGTFYWVSLDGTVLLRGDPVEDTELLQSTFADAVARAGASR
jgi:hypothetical protein